MISTKYFSEGVSVTAWTTDKPPKLSVRIAREGEQIDFLELDSLVRAVHHVLRWATEKRKDITMWKPGFSCSVHDCVVFAGLDEATACIGEVEKAVRYIQATCPSDPEWQEIRLADLVKELELLAADATQPTR